MQITLETAINLFAAGFRCGEDWRSKKCDRSALFASQAEIEADAIYIINNILGTFFCTKKVEQKTISN